jgi:hypothetical protein
MAKLKLAEALRRLNTRYGTNWTYQHGYMAAVANIIPAERDDTGRFWMIDESNLTATRKGLGQLPTKKSIIKPAGKPSAKPKSVAKPAPNRPARSRASRSAAA